MTFFIQPVFSTDRDPPSIPDQPLAPSLPARHGTKTVTPDWLLERSKPISDRPIFSRIRWFDDNHLLFDSPPKQSSQEEWNIELLNIHTYKHSVIGQGENPISSTDHQWIAFTKGNKEARQLWVMDRNGKNEKQLTHIEHGLGNAFAYQYSFDFSWSPDSEKIALSHQPYVPYWEKKPQAPSTISIIDIRTGEAKQKASIDGGVRTICWFPNGDKLLFMKERVGSDYNEEEDYEWVISLNIKDGSLRTLAEFDGLQQSLQPTLSPDGNRIAILYDADNPIYDFMLSIGIIAIDDVNPNPKLPPKRLTHELTLRSPQWSHDSQYIYVRRDYGAYKQIYSIDVKTGEATQITSAHLDIESYALSPDQSKLAWVGQDAQANRIIQIASTDGRDVKDIAKISGPPEDMALSEVREIAWNVPDYPVPMRGLLFMPLNYQKGTQYPLIVDIHGGGAGASISLADGGGILMDSPLEWHMWTAKGYAVFVPELRSSASFGSLAITRDELTNHDLINCDIKDVEAGIDSLVAKGIVDPQRLAAIGHSAGGRRVNWLVASTHRFKAVVSKEGWACDWIPKLAQSPLKRAYQMFGGAPWEVPQNYQKNSALFHCRGATTPTLFLMGNPELGGVDPNKTVLMLHNVLKGQKVETEYVQYLDEGHVLEKPKNKRDALERSIKWIDDHLGSNM